MTAPVPSHRLVLASHSPRRALLLREAGFAFDVVDPPYVDPADPNEAGGDGAKGRSLAGRLARRKALSVDRAAWPAGKGKAVLLSADTLGIDADGRLLGTPQTADEALAMLTSLAGSTHRIVTGVALLCWDPAVRPILGQITDTATVHLGPLTAEQLREYVATGDWAGKAGGYNLAERLDAGWAIRVDGDPATVMGLPMQRLIPRLAAWGVVPADKSHAIAACGLAPVRGEPGAKPQAANATSSATPPAARASAAESVAR